MDVRSLILIYRSIENTSIDQIKIENKNIKLRMVKGEEAVESELKLPISPYLKMDNYEGEEAGLVPDKKGASVNNNDICSTHVGFFSRFDKAAGKQYVKLRDVINKGDVIGTITVLDMQHEVIANQEGKIIHFLVEEGQPVEYGQPLVRLEKPVNKDGSNNQ